MKTGLPIVVDESRVLLRVVSVDVSDTGDLLETFAALSAGAPLPFATHFAWGPKVLEKVRSSGLGDSMLGVNICVSVMVSVIRFMQTQFRVEPKDIMHALHDQVRRNQEIDLATPEPPESN